MKLRLARISSLSSCLLSPKLFSRSISCQPNSIHYPPISSNPQIPLFLRPPKFSATLSDLQKWQEWAKTLASSVGASFLDLDNGPDTDLLNRELNWLIQDAIENSKTLTTQNLEKESVLVSIRAELGDLYMLWKQRIEERRPFQYIVGCEHWRDLVLSVEDGVLIPRPETELIVDLVGNVIEGNVGLGQGAWADLGTGSGAIAIGIARILGNHGRVIATDLSPVAVKVASFNVERYSLQGKVEIKQGSWFEPLKEAEGQLAGLVSNPPYIPSENISGLQAEVGKHEPRLALDGGKDGMDDLLLLCNGAAAMLKHGGFFAFETNGEDQCNSLVNYMETVFKERFCNLNIVADFAGIKRFVTGFRA